MAEQPRHTEEMEALPSLRPGLMEGAMIRKTVHVGKNSPSRLILTYKLFYRHMSGQTSRHVEPDAASTAACQTRTDETSDAVIEVQEQTSCERNRQGLSHSRQNKDTSEKTCLIRRSTLYWRAGTCLVLFTPRHPIFRVVVETFTREHGTLWFDGRRRRNEWPVPTRWCRTYSTSFRQHALLSLNLMVCVRRSRRRTHFLHSHRNLPVWWRSQCRD